MTRSCSVHIHLPFSQIPPHLNLLAILQSAYVCAMDKSHERGTMASTHINNTGARAGWKGFVGLVVAAAIGFAFMPGFAQAESFSKLEKQGYAVGKLTKGKAGGYGWIISNSNKRFFCRLNASLAYVSKKEMVGITSSGRLIKVDRATFEAKIGGPDPSIPQWSDLQSGRVKPDDVGSCTPVR
ncbi:hypothetical protein [Rhizobium leguminosarum]|uniref:hypothetical protein n=1 Tax=Rhizobium leguminosarum TaxID=384 RepID=UPI001FE09F23|nr:hypothetical protein [Rhizobium leguminosarum]